MFIELKLTNFWKKMHTFLLPDPEAAPPHCGFLATRLTRSRTFYFPYNNSQTQYFEGNDLKERKYA